MNYLSGYGFSEKFISSFFVPFLAGACLDKDINISSRVLKYLFCVFAKEDATLPSKGMEEIPRQMSDSLGPEKIQFQSKAIKVSDGSVTLEDGRTIFGKQIVAATPESILRDLLDIKTVNRSVGKAVSTNLQAGSPLQGTFFISQWCWVWPNEQYFFPSMLAEKYTPAGKTLIAVVVDNQFIKRSGLEGEVRSQCREWFRDIFNEWEHLRTYQIEHALPA